MSKNLMSYCGQCGCRAMSSMDLQRDRLNDQAKISLPKNVEIQDPHDPGRVVRTTVMELHIQKPALICNACQADRDDIPTAAPIYVGGSKQ